MSRLAYELEMLRGKRITVLGLAFLLMAEIVWGESSCAK